MKQYFKRQTSKSIILFFILFLLIPSLDLMAQCAMCKATATSNQNDGGSIAKGLNSGILYLMGIPYLLMCGLAYLFFKKQILEKVNLLKLKFKPKHFNAKQ